MKARILVVDDEVVIVKALVKHLNREGFEVESASDGPEAIEKNKERHFDLLLTDLKLPSMNGIELIKEIRELDPNIGCLVMTGYGSIASAVEAMKAGAFHYITKPFELDDVSQLVRTVLEHTRLQEQNRILQRQVKTRYGFENIIGASDEIKEVLRLVNQVADTDSTVLILGESGTGKELIARAIHYNSRRAPKPLIPVNCGAIPENLLESELFGHMKGSFTGAIASKIGRFEVANGGTIFLDEIGDMSLRLQVKILRVLQEKKFEPVGSTKTVEVDVRIITATNQDLEKLVERGNFREDLYYRLNVIPVTVPPLRNRTSDIPLLVDHFLNVFEEANQLPPPRLSDEIMELFMKYKWPGNIRELENTIERLAVLKAGKTIMVDDLPEKFLAVDNVLYRHTSFPIPDDGISLKRLVDDFENTLILKALEKTGWNKNKAAHLLRLNRTTLVEKIKKKQLEKHVN